MTFAGVPNSFVNGTTADAPSVNQDFDAVTTGLNNIDAGQVTTGTLPITRGGTGAVTAPAALTALLSGSTVPVANGGTGAATAATALTALLSGSSVPVANGGTGQTATPLFSSSNPTSGGSITAASQLMFGLNTAFTPATTGKMKLTVTGTLTMGTTAQAYTLQLRSAAGAPPTFGAAASGTVLSAASWSSVANSQAIQFTLVGLITLTAGVAAWVDVSALTSGGAAASITSITANIDEKPI